MTREEWQVLLLVLGLQVAAAIRLLVLKHFCAPGLAGGLGSRREKPLRGSIFQTFPAVQTQQCPLTRLSLEKDDFSLRDRERKTAEGLCRLYFPKMATAMD